jgi:hypothetical protein
MGALFNMPIGASIQGNGIFNRGESLQKVRDITQQVREPPQKVMKFSI